MDLPKNERTFDFDYIGEVTGKKWEGQFTTKCMLNLAEKRFLEIEKSRLTADLMNPTTSLDTRSTVIANLRVRIIDSPAWFQQIINTLDILDEGVLYELYGKCLDKTEEWLTEIKKDAGEKSEGEEQRES